MRIIDVEQNSQEWLDARKGKVTGSRLGDIWSARSYTKEDLTTVLDKSGIEYKKSANKAELELLLTPELRSELLANSPRKLGFYELLADNLALSRDDEDAMERGLRLEPVAREWFATEYNKVVEQAGLCVSDIDERISNSPDGLVKDGEKYTEAVEIKCLCPARHLQVIIENEIPEEFWTQKIQYFVVNPDLQKLYFIFYNPEVTAKPYHIIEVTREELGDKPEEVLQFQISQLKQIDALLEQLAF